MGNKVNKIEKIQIHTRGIYDKYCFVLETDYEVLEPHTGEIPYTRDNVISEINAIIKALDYLDFIQIKYDPIHICLSSQETITFIEDCIYNRNHDKIVQKILLLLSDKNVRFFHVNHDQNHANMFLNS